MPTFTAHSAPDTDARDGAFVTAHHEPAPQPPPRPLPARRERDQLEAMIARMNAAAHATAAECHAHDCECGNSAIVLTFVGYRCWTCFAEFVGVEP